MFSYSEESVLVNVLAGMTSGAVASAIANPTDVLKVVWSDLVFLGLHSEN